ncbi:MAG: hypothetical protein ACR2PS_01845 [Pseudomonadales bacterium]
MKTSDLQFNIIYTPDTVRYLTPFVPTLLKWSDCRFRLVANGCSDDESALLESICALDNRLELLVMPEKRMVPHGETLDFLHERTDSDYFCFMDSDILATGPFLDDFRDDLNNAEVFSSCLPLWHNPADVIIPDYFETMHGIHAYTRSGMTIACDYFVVYDNKAFTEARETTGVGLAVIGWDEIAPENQKILREMGQKRTSYDSGKALTLLMTRRGSRIRYRESDRLKHIGGFTEVGALETEPMHARNRLDVFASWLPRLLGRRVIVFADLAYIWKRGRKKISLRENISWVGRARRRAITARYFYLLLVGLMDDRPVPEVPLLGDAVAEKRLHDVTEDIRALVEKLRIEPGPWQDKSQA